MRFRNKQKPVYFAIDQALVKRHHILKLSGAFLNVALLSIVVVASLLTNNNQPVLAAAYTWDGEGATNNWSDCTNWSTNVCPVAADTVTFNATSTKASIVDAGFGGTVAGVTVAAGYTGTLTLDRSLTSTGVFTQASGSTFAAGSNDLFVGTTFTISTGATFNAGTGRVVFRGTTSGILTCANTTVFNRVAFEHTAGTKTVQTGCSFPIGSDPALTAGVTVNGGQLVGTGTITTSANLTLNAGTPLSGFNGLIVNGSLLVSGTSTVNLSSYLLVDVNSSFSVSNSSNFVAPAAQMSVSGAFTVSTSGTYNPNGGTIIFDGGSAAITCGVATFSHVGFAHAGTKTINSGCDLPLGDNPVIPSGILLSGSLSGTGVLTIAGTFTLGGNITGFNGIHK